MNEVYNPSTESFTKTVTALGVQAKDKLSDQIKREPVKTFSLLLVGSILVSILIGYRLSRMEEESKRERFVENWMHELTNWIGQNGRKIAAPLKDSLEATKSAVEDVSNSGARLGRQWQPFLEKQKRSLLNLF